MGFFRRKFLLLALLLSFVVVIFISQTSKSHYQREIQIEDLHFNLYNRDKGSFISENSNNFMERIESKNRNLLLRDVNLMDYKNKEVEMNNRLERINRRYQNEMTQLKRKNNENRQHDDDVLHPKPMETTTQKMMNIINNLSSKVDDLMKTVQQNDAKSMKKEEKAKVINLSDHKKCRNPHILFLVTSHSSNVERRAIIRKNWGDENKFQSLLKRFNFTYDIYFSVGLGNSYEENEQIKKESKSYRDILIIDRNEDFYDLTRRVMAGFEWAVDNCQFRHLFKMDDDIFINIPNVFSFVTKYNNESKLYAGDMNIEAFVNRNPKSKYSVTYEEWPVETYPPYCSGGGFIISRDIVKSIIPYFDWVNPYKIDDVYVGILIQRAKMKGVKYYIPDDENMFWFYSNSSTCHYKKTSLVFHKVEDEECMTKLTFQSIMEMPKATKEIADIVNRPPPSLEDFAKMIKLPKEYTRKSNAQTTNKKPSIDSMPSLGNLPRALSPIEYKKKKAREYFARLHSF